MLLICLQSGISILPGHLEEASSVTLEATGTIVQRIPDQESPPLCASFACYGMVPPGAVISDWLMESKSKIAQVEPAHRWIMINSVLITFKMCPPW